MENNTNQSYPCDICNKRSISNTASVWCPHCEDHLCSECSGHHGASRSTSGHHTISINDNQNLPQYVVAVKHRCSTHKEEFEFYCPSHAVPCCVDCTKDIHGSCSELKPLHDVVSKVKTSNNFQDIEHHLSDIAENIAKLTREREQNVASLAEQKSKHLETIKLTRQRIDQHLDNIEKSLVQELTGTHDKAKLQIENLIDKLNKRKEKANAIQEEIRITKQAASDLQTFIGMRELRKNVEEEGKILFKLQQDENFHHSSTHITYSDILSGFSDRVPIFGEVLIETSPKQLSLIVGKGRHSQIILPKLKGLEQIRVRPKQTIKFPNTSSKGFNISGCKIADNGKLLFVDWKQDHLLSCNNDGTGIRVVAEFPKSGPLDVTCISEDTVAVSLRASKSIALVEYSSGKILKTFSVNGECFGIDHKSGNILARLVTEGIFLTVDVNGKIISNVNVPGDRLRYFTLFNDKIYCTVTGQNSVICMNMMGSVIWTFQNVLLREPFGVTVDSNGFVYVAGRASNNVILISPDGRRSRVILEERNGIAKPQALHVSQLRRQLLVCNKNNGCSILFEFF